MGTSRVLRVAVLGFGAIGARVASALASARVPGSVLAGVITRSPERVAPYGYPVIARADAPVACDLVVECAGVATLRDAGPGLIAAGVDLLPASLGRSPILAYALSYLIRGRADAFSPQEPLAGSNCCRLPPGTVDSTPSR